MDNAEKSLFFKDDTVSKDETINSVHVENASTKLSEIANMMNTSAGETSSRADRVTTSAAELNAIVGSIKI